MIRVVTSLPNSSRIKNNSVIHLFANTGSFYILYDPVGQKGSEAAGRGLNPGIGYNFHILYSKL